MCFVHVLTHVHIESPFQSEDTHDGLVKPIFGSDEHLLGKILVRILHIRI